MGRYLTPLPPPPQLTGESGDSDEETLNGLIGFVAAIPSAGVNFPAASTRIWLTCQVNATHCNRIHISET